jgi:DNA-binding transcriptional MerR regulator
MDATTKKIYYSISEVCQITTLEPHVLRYWESEFTQLHPKKNRAGNRAYRDKDIEIIKYIKHLLYEEKFTIPGAKKKLSGSKDSDPEQLKLELPVIPEASSSSITTVDEIKGELFKILEFLKS